MDMGLPALLNAHVSSGFFAQGWQLLGLGARPIVGARRYGDRIWRSGNSLENTQLL